MIWPRPLLATCLWYIDTAQCARPSDPRPAWVFNPRGAHQFFYSLLSVLAFPSSGTEQPEFLLTVLRSQVGQEVLCHCGPAAVAGLAQQPALQLVLTSRRCAGFWLFPAYV